MSQANVPLPVPSMVLEWCERSCSSLHSNTLPAAYAARSHNTPEPEARPEAPQALNAAIRPSPSVCRQLLKPKSGEYCVLGTVAPTNDLRVRAPLGIIL